MNITNSADVDCHVPTLPPLNDYGQTFTELSDGTAVPDRIGMPRKVRPHAAVANGNKQIVSYIGLPLNFAAFQKGL